MTLSLMFIHCGFLRHVTASTVFVYYGFVKSKSAIFNKKYNTNLTYSNPLPKFFF